ncbi:response regulator [Thiospirochaeta perfilievii]|uniref:Response regulator n=1 Tax=Thiospirochaeta perfilievii TaxID=252967 RepID=A0A5C1Q9V0_9SPIO|nr:response regulator [Thiospirochaeta perfilievii]QEN04118.1 response regulator [Thiospirochaeta perfilievii]
MIKTLIVDDEPNIREGLKIVIEWEKLGFQVVGEAASGVEALRKIEELQPAVVITDVKMPKMSGLELAAECVKKELNISFIILSGHGEFSMAKQALNLGVNDYLLKPVDEDELTEALIKLKKDKFSSISRHHSEPIYLQAQFDQLLSSNRERELPEIKRLFKIDNQISFYYVIVDSRGNIPVDTIKGLIQKTLPSNSTISLKKHMCGSYGFMIHSTMLKDYNHSINIYLMDLISFVYKETLKEVSIYLGTKKRNLYELKDSMDEAVIASVHRYYRESGIIIDYNNIQHLDFCDEYSETQYIDDILNGVLDRDRGEVTRSINNLVNYFLDQYLSAHIIYLHLNRLLNRVLESVQKLGGDSEKIIHKADFIIKRESQIYLYSLPNKIEGLMDVVLNIINKLKNKSSLGLELKEYIDVNFRENLSLKCVADKFNVNPAYLGQVFKKETGTSFNSYFHTLRLNEASKLLLQSNIKIYEVAQSVGYMDVNYFMKKFERQFSTTPKQYRKNYNKSIKI